MLYSWIVKRVVRRGFRHLSQGAYDLVLRQFAPDVDFAFAGTHPLGGERHGRAAVRAWFQQLYGWFPGIQFAVHQVVVEGWPWNTLAATHFSVTAPRPDGSLYQNDGMQLVRLRWGRVVEDRLYEDTQRLALELDQRAGTHAVMPGVALRQPAVPDCPATPA